MKAKGKRKSEPKDLTLTDMLKFHRSVNWMEWWEEFNTALTPDGHYLHSTVTMFAKRKSKNNTQLRFLLWYCGSKTEGDPTRYGNLEPLDWKKKRDTGGWYTDEAMKLMGRQITQAQNALEALRLAGNSVTLKFFSRIGVLVQKLDEAFKGQLFIPELSFAENVARVRIYFELGGVLKDQLKDVSDIYAKSHGVNFANMEGFAQLVTASAMAMQGPSKEKTRVEEAMSNIISMTMVKSAKFDLPLPKEMEKEVIDVSSERVPDPKKKVQ